MHETGHSSTSDRLNNANR